MGRIFELENVTVLNNIPEELLLADWNALEEFANELAEEILDNDAILDISKDTIVRVLQNEDMLIVQYDDTKHFAEKRIENWF